MRHGMCGKATARSPVGAGLRRGPVGKQPCRFRHHGGIALADVFFERFAIEHIDATPAAADRTHALQFADRLGNAFTSYAERAGDQFVGRREYVAGHPIQAEQQVPAQLLLQRVAPVHTAVCAICMSSDCV